MKTVAAAITAAAFPAILEGPAWLAGHWSVEQEIVAYACEAQAAPYLDRKEWGRRARDHYRARSAGAVKALEPTWIGVRGMDVGRKLSDGTRVGCDPGEFIKGMATGIFEIGGEVELLRECVDQCRGDYLAGTGEKFLPVNSEPWSEMHAYRRPETLTRRDGETDAAFAERKELARQLCKAWDGVYRDKAFLRRINKLDPRAGECGPDTWGDINRLNIARVTGARVFHQAKLATIRVILREAELLVPGVRPVVSFCRFGSSTMDAHGINDEPIPALTAPRDPGVKWASNWQIYLRSWRAVAIAAAFRQASAGLVVPTIWGADWDTAAGIIRVGARGGVIGYVDEDMRAEAEGRAAYEGEKRKSSEDWMANQFASLITAHRKAA